MEIVGNVKNYDWGKLGSKSLVAKLAAMNDGCFSIEEKRPYSELWMGDHSSGPSKVKRTGEELSTSKKESLSFLFKVLSIRKALSIQVHPNKDEAQHLHKTRPDIYKDPNHKPELAIALTPFVALCGFRPYTEIYDFCVKLPPLKELIGGETKVEALQSGKTEALAECYKILMKSNEADITNCIQIIATDYIEVLSAHNLLKLFKQINNDFPNDVGLLSLFFLNVMRLEPGQAIFLRANEIHAYLGGDCIECMACSDNVIRAGLTPKYKDVEQLISSLNYEGKTANENIFRPCRLNEYVQIFDPPVDDFAVVHMKLPMKLQTFHLRLLTCDTIMIVLQGKRKLHLENCKEILVVPGSIVFIPAEKANDVHFVLDEPPTENFDVYFATKYLVKTFEPNC